MKAPLYTFLFAIVLLASCSTGSKFASSFGKRRYTKGYFWNVKCNASAVASNKRAQEHELALPLNDGRVYTVPKKIVSVAQTLQVATTTNVKASTGKRVKIAERKSLESISKTAASEAADNVKGITAVSTHSSDSGDGAILGFLSYLLALIGSVWASLRLLLVVLLDGGGSASLTLLLGFFMWPGIFLATSLLLSIFTLLHTDFNHRHAQTALIISAVSLLVILIVIFSIAK